MDFAFYPQDSEMAKKLLCYKIEWSTSNDRCDPFCDCEFPCANIISRYKGNPPDLVKCRCSEDKPFHRLQWLWQQDNSESDIIASGSDVTFHPTYSQGTALVKGQMPLEPGLIHYWEISILTPLSGTDVMFGIATDKFDIRTFRFRFASALGSDSQSWGLSFEGRIQHAGRKVRYGQKFSQGCLVGVLVDRTRGHLEFFLNRRSQGVAYTNIPTDASVTLYPIVCSTAAKSAIRLSNSTSQADSLQLRAFRALAKVPKALEELKQLPGLRSILRDYWFLAPPVRYSRHSKENEHDILDEAVLSSKNRLSRKQKYKDDEEDGDDLYGNAHKIPFHENSDSDSSDSASHDYFDEHFNYLH